jgi:DNA-damage-inducible protein D
MTDRTYESRYGIDAPLEDEIGRFAAITQEDLEDVGTEDDLIPEGELALVPFKNVQIRKVFHSGEWWFSVVDVIAALTDSTRPRKYWSDLKRQLTEKEGHSELSEKIGQLALPGADGKAYQTDVVNTETLLRIIQSVPSPRAEPSSDGWLRSVTSGFRKSRTRRSRLGARSSCIKSKVIPMNGSRNESALL